MISQKTIQDIFDTAKVEDIVGDYVDLRKRGVNLLGLCPFHNEKTPSFTVSPAKNIYKCFGCGQGGGPIQFLMEHDSMTYPEALRNLAVRYGIEIEEDESNEKNAEERQLIDSLYIINNYALDFYKKTLFETAEGKSVGLSYFKERGFNQATIEKFGLGITFNSPDALTKSAVSNSYNIELLKKLGLTSKHGRDFFRNRVMFPIHHVNGKVIGFAGRILKPDKKAPKYLNSPETEIYHKSNVLYASHLAKGPMRKKDECILVEGYTDVISLHQAGIENVVASSGTSLTVGQIKLIRRYTQNIKILYDGDAAGIKAALRGLDLVLQQDLNVKVVLLPEGHDPDSYLKEVGSTAFETFIDRQAKDFILFKTDLLLKETENDPIKRTGLVKDIVSSIALIPDPIKRSVYIQQCSQLLEMSEQILISALNKDVSEVLQKKRKDKEREERRASADFPTDAPPEGDTTDPRPEVPSRAADNYQEMHIVKLLMNDGDKYYNEEDKVTVAEFILGNIEDIIDEFDNPVYQQIVKEYHASLINDKQLALSYFVNHKNKEIAKLAVNLSSSQFEMSENWKKLWDIELQTQPIPDENYVTDGMHALLHFKFRKIMKMLNRNKLLLKDIPSGDKDQLMNIINKHQQLTDLRNEIAAKLKLVIIR